MSTWIVNEDGTRTLLHKTERPAPLPAAPEQPESTESPAPSPKAPRTKTPSEVADANR